MPEQLSRSVLALFDAPAIHLDLAQISALLDVDRPTAERAVRALLRAGRLVRVHAGPGALVYALPQAAMPLPVPTVCTEALGSTAGKRPGTLTRRLLDVLEHYRVPMRTAEVVLLAGLPDDARQVSRVSATLCMLARRGRLRRDSIDGFGVCYAVPSAPDRARGPLLPRELIDAGFRPTIPRDGETPLALAEWLPDQEMPAQLSSAAICQRIRRGWPPELAVSLPLLKRQAA
jgi:hypothetical protein